MAVNTPEAFTLDTAAGTSFGATSSAVALPGIPGSDLVVRICNLGPCHLACKLGGSGVTVTPSTGIVVLAGQVLVLALAGATYIAGVSCGGTGTASTVNIATGS
jgi:hypothetical protein